MDYNKQKRRRGESKAISRTWGRYPSRKGRDVYGLIPHTKNGSTSYIVCQTIKIHVYITKIPTAKGVQRLQNRGQKGGN